MKPEVFNRFFAISFVLIFTLSIFFTNTAFAQEENNGRAWWNIIGRGYDSFTNYFERAGFESEVTRAVNEGRYEDAEFLQQQAQEMYKDNPCGITDLDCNFRHMIGVSAAGILSAGGEVLGWFGWVFDKSVEYTVLNVGTMFAPGSPYDRLVTDIWKIFRDIGNIIIIFSLLYLAIRTILEGNGFAQTKILSSILLAAILINFSLFFTKLVFDASNWTGITIYQQIKDPGGAYGTGTISEGVMKLVNLQGVQHKLTADIGSWGALTKTMVNSLFMLTLFAILAIIFISAAILLLYRFFIFLFLMMTSPIGLVAHFVPWMSSFGQKWFEQLKKQFLSLPTFFITLFIGLYATGTIFRDSFSTSAVDLMNNVDRLSMYIVSFILLVFFMGMSLITPGYVGAAGSSFGTGMVKKFKGYGQSTLNWAKARPGAVGKWAGRTSFGAVSGGVARTGQAIYGGNARKILADDNLKRAALAGDKKALKKLRTAEKTANRTFDMRNIKVGGKTLGERGLGQGIENYEKRVKAAQDKLQQKADAEMKLMGAKDQKAPAAEMRMANREKMNADDMVKKAKSNLQAARAGRSSGTHTAKQLLEAERELEKAQGAQSKAMSEVARLSNYGESEYYKLMNSRAKKMGKIAQAATKNIVTKGTKNWTKGKDKKALEELAKMIGTGSSS